MKHSLVDSLYAERFEECQLALKVFQNKFPRIINLSQVDYGMLEICKSRLGDTLYRRALHVIGENERVSKLSKAINDYDCEAIGALMYQSHKSSRLNFENSTEELDFLVNSIKKYASVYGARLTGGGFGGAIVVLAKNTLSSELENEIRLAYKREFNIELSTLCTRSEDGARILN